MNERRLIGNILAEDGESEEDQSKYTRVRRIILLSKEELGKIYNRRLSDPGIKTTSWPDEEYDLFEERKQSDQQKPFLDTKAPEYIPEKASKCEYSGKILVMAREQNNSRVLQKRLETMNSDEKQAVFEECMKNIKELIDDVFGNFVIQKLIEVSTQEQRKILSFSLSGKIIEYSQSTYACRVIQKLLEYVETDQKRNIVNEFKGNLENCLENDYSNHVLQKCIEELPFNYFEFIVNFMKTKALY